ncbi:exported hypothetical protein [Candidatus Sulfotelmatobacter kueseliae]|uniref:Uncharacterized protein n=1 Tax=Candidatus Sulfotelmatobacter kueseliae TaxID=2042962 RepID=A0A2U3KMZ7_9BACT|nr:exported hypothetical protein [Candidatus Sulfotelmatobacter kueseliae]
MCGRRAGRRKLCNAASFPFASSASSLLCGKALDLPLSPRICLNQDRRNCGARPVFPEIAVPENGAPVTVVDIHSHILPAVDDGPKTWDECVAMCRAAAAGGHVPRRGRRWHHPHGGHAARQRPLRL